MPGIIFFLWLHFMRMFLSNILKNIKSRKKNCWSIYTGSARSVKVRTDGLFTLLILMFIMAEMMTVQTHRIRKTLQTRSLTSKSGIRKHRDLSLNFSVEIYLRDNFGKFLDHMDRKLNFKVTNPHIKLRPLILSKGILQCPKHSCFSQVSWLTQTPYTFLYCYDQVIFKPKLWVGLNHRSTSEF